jgi:hypothetical protein
VKVMKNNMDIIAMMMLGIAIVVSTLSYFSQFFVDCLLYSLIFIAITLLHAHTALLLIICFLQILKNKINRPMPQIRNKDRYGSSNSI